MSFSEIAGGSYRRRGTLSRVFFFTFSTMVALLALQDSPTWHRGFPGHAGLAQVQAAGRPVSDDFLIDTIRQKLAADAVVRGGAIEVIVKDGAVTLRGKVEEEKQRSRAEKIAKKVSGVKAVMNELQLSRP